jgi:hypothetical protein
MEGICDVSLQRHACKQAEDLKVGQPTVHFF